MSTITFFKGIKKLNRNDVFEFLDDRNSAKLGDLVCGEKYENEMSRKTHVNENVSEKNNTVLKDEWFD